ncbi:MAG: MalY/PatB family protein [Jatrophihabitans sp.]
MSETYSYDALTPDDLRARGTVKWNYFDPDVLALWVAEMDYPAPPVVRAAIQAAVDREEFGYPRMEGATGLPEATADWSESRYGWKIDPSRVHVLPDVLKGVELAIESYSPAGSAVILLTPAYMPFFEVPKIIERPIVEVPMAVADDRFVLDLEGIDAAFAAGAGTLILCQPYNPLGRCFTREELLQLSQVVAKHGGRVASDEIHAPLVYANKHVPYASISDEAAAHTITLVSASKAWNLPGLKCAQLITSTDVDEDRWRQISMMKTHGASTMGIASNLAAFRSGGEWLDNTLAYLDTNRRLLGSLLQEHLPGVGYRVPEATYMAWLDFSALDLPDEPAAFFLEEARVAMNPGLAFGANGAGCARLNFATTTAILEQAITAMGKAVQNR